MQVVVAVDLGGTLLRTAVVSAAREILHQTVRPVGDRRGNTAIGRLLREAVTDAREALRPCNWEPTGVGLAVPGVVDAQAGMIRYSANLQLDALPVRDIVQEVLPGVVVVENDVRAAAWGEFHWGAGRGVRHMVYLSAGTGIAAAAVCEGRLYRGRAGAAGELGHVVVVPDGEQCRCGQRGCLETVAGGWGIARRAARRAGTESPLSAEAVFEAARAGDPGARDVIREAGKFLGRAAVLLVRLWDPERLVLGGGLFFDGSPLLDAVRRAVQTGGLAGTSPPAVERAVFGPNAGLLGAACLVHAPP